MERVAALIPAFNAAQTLSELIARIERHIPRTDVIVVDDGSTDNTYDVAMSCRVQVLKHEQNFGKGRALRTGFEQIRRMQEYQAVVTMDADLQHEPEELPGFFAIRELQHADIVIGHRPRWGTNMPLPRKFSNAITSALVSARTGALILDSQCGYRLMTRRVLESISTISDGYEAETELLVKAARKGFNIAFVPIRTVYANEATHMTNVKTTVRFLSILLTEY